MQATRKILLTFLLILGVTNTANAGFFDSEYFIPAVTGSVGALVCYASQDGEDGQAQTAAICGAVGAFAGYGLQNYFRNKYYKKAEVEIEDKDTVIQNMKLMQAQKASRGEDVEYSIKLREYVPGRKHSDGSVSSPYIRERLEVPGEATMIGH